MVLQGSYKEWLSRRKDPATRIGILQDSCKYALVEFCFRWMLQQHYHYRVLFAEKFRDIIACLYCLFETK